MPFFLFIFLFFLFSDYSAAQNQNKIDSFKNVLNSLSQNTNDTATGNILHDIGKEYMHQGNYVDAVDYFLKALQVFEKNKQYKNIAGCKTNIGNIYFYVKNYDKAIHYYKEAMSINKQTGNSQGVADLLNNMGNVHQVKKEYDKALQSYSESIKVKEGLHDKKGIVSSLINMGCVYSNLDQDDKALGYFFRADALIDTSDIESKMYSLTNIGYIYLNQKENQKALPLFEKYLKFAKKLDSKEDLKIAYYNLSEVYSNVKQYQKAYEYHRLYSFVNDSLVNQGNQDKISELIHQQQLEKQKQELNSFKKEKIINDLSIKQYRIQIGILIAGLLLLLVTSVFIYKWNQLKQKRELEKEKTLQREMMIKTVIETQEEERKRIARDLHDSVGQLLTALKLSWQDIWINAKGIPAESKEKISKSIPVINQIADELRIVAHQMMPNTLNESGLVSAIDELLKGSLAQANIVFQLESYKIDQKYNEAVEINLYRITQELINNIVKHAQATEVYVQVFTNEKQIILIVEDNGKGIENNVPKGSGLINIRTRVLALKGDFSIVPSPQKGTIATIRVPFS